MSRVAVRRVGAGPEWELVHPTCAQERALDLDEVRDMLDAGETQIAIDELRWLLEDCHEFLAAHRLLGELALGEDDLKLDTARDVIAQMLRFDPSDPLNVQALIDVG
jgi:hypothetical protein